MQKHMLLRTGTRHMLHKKHVRVQEFSEIILYSDCGSWHLTFAQTHLRIHASTENSIFKFYTYPARNAVWAHIIVSLPVSSYCFLRLRKTLSHYIKHNLTVFNYFLKYQTISVLSHIYIFIHSHNTAKHTEGSTVVWMCGRWWSCATAVLLLLAAFPCHCFISMFMDVCAAHDDINLFNPEALRWDIESTIKYAVRW